MQEDFLYKISADAQSFTKEMQKVEKTTKTINKTAQEEGKKTIEVEKLTLKQMREKAAEERKLGYEAKKIFESTRTAAEKYQKQVEDLKNHLKEGRISQEDYNRAMKDAADAKANASKSTSGFGSSLTSMLNPATLAATALAAVAAGAIASYKAFQEDKKATDELSMSLKSLGVEGAHLQEVFKGNAAEFGYATKDQREAYHTMIRITGDATQAEEDLKKAFDISARTGASLVDSSKAIAQARMGNVSALQDLTLLSAKEVALLDQIDDKGVKASLALEAIEKHTLGASKETEKLTKRLNENTEAFDEMKKSVGEAASELVNLAGGQGFFARHLDNAMNDIRKNMGEIALGAKFLGSGKTMDVFVAEMVKAENAASKASLAIGQMSLNLDYSPDGYTDSERKIAGAKLKEDLSGIALLRKAREESDRTQRTSKQAQEALAQKALDMRIEISNYDLSILREKDELNQEELRRRKEIYQLEQTITDKTELKLRTDLAREQSAQRILDIQTKAADLQKKLEGPSSSQFSLQAKVLASLQTPLDNYAQSLDDLDGIYRRGMLTTVQYEQAVLTLNDALIGTPKEVEKAKDEISEMATIVAGVGSAMYDGLADGLFDPMNFSFEDMANNAIKQIGRIALEMLSLKALEAAGGSAAGGGWAGLISGLFSGAPALATGGYVSGPGTGTSDSIPAFLSNGEFVIPAKSTAHYGTDYLENLRKMRVPKHHRYAEGGLVTRSGSQPSGGVQTTNNNSSPTNLNIVNVTPESAPDYLASRAGEKTILNILSKNSKAIKTILN